MAKLVFLLDGNVIKETVLTKERMTIGRRASNDIHIDNLAISGNHAVVVTTADGSYIEDLNSTNGTIVNKVKIKKHQLADGDLVKLGKHQLRYLEDETIHKLQHDGFESTVLVVESNEPKHKRSTAQATVAPKAKPEPANKVEQAKALPRLTILNGEDVGATLMLDKAIVKIGQPNEQLALVTKRSQGYFISQVVGEGDGVLVNSKPIDAHAHALHNHDEVEMLGIKMEFRLD